VDELRDQPVDHAFAGRFAETQQRLLALNDRLHPEDFPPEVLAEIRNVILKWIAAADAFDDARPLDTVDMFLLHAEALRHLVRDALDAHVTGAGDDAGALARQLGEWLPGVTQAELARLAGISDRQFQRWKKNGGKAPRRLTLVARLVAILRRGWTGEGVVAWFRRPRADLDGKRPVDVLDDPAYELRLVAAVRQGRAGHGS
jgi:uncharacterized protein (DUF2384 family)